MASVRKTYEKLKIQILKDLANQIPIAEHSKVSAICEHSSPTDLSLYKQVGDLREITLELGFDELNERDQQMVAKTCIHAHRRLLNGEVPCFGKVLYYQLYMPNNSLCKYFTFDTSGKYISNDKLN